MNKKRCNSCFLYYDGNLDMCPYCGYEDGDLAEEPFFLHPGMVLNDRYIIGKVLGFGGFGITYKAWDKNLETIVAIKEYYFSGIANRDPGTQTVLVYAQNRRAEFRHFLERFLDEARYTAKFGSKNSNIVYVYEFFEANNTAYMVMEFLDGVTLRDALKKNPMDVNRCNAVMSTICSALNTVHEDGIIHRDVSPDNIMLCNNGKVKLFDFGAARFSKNEDQEIRKLTQVMKPGFSPPEQYQSISKQGPWTDVYALGATLYYMITGVKPIESTNRIEEGKDNLIPPKGLNADIPDHINDTILRAMAVEMHLRFPSADEFEKALNKKKRVLGVAKEKKRRRKKRVFGLISAILAIAVGFAALAYYYKQDEYENTLPDSKIVFWYSLPEDLGLAEAKSDSYQSIVDIFLDQYPGTKARIILNPIPDNEYNQAINDAYGYSTMPQLFESARIDGSVLRALPGVEEAVQMVDTTNVLFFDAYRSSFPDYRQFPAGFTAPVRYTYTAPLSGDAVQGNRDKAGFLSGEIPEYDGSTADYYEVQLALSGKYSISPIDKEEAACLFTDLLSIGDCDKDQLTIAYRFLVFLLSENAQNFIHIQYRSGSLPLNRDALATFVALNDEFDGFFDSIESYVIK